MQISALMYLKQRFDLLLTITATNWWITNWTLEPEVL